MSFFLHRAGVMNLQIPTFEGGNQSHDSVYEFLQYLANYNTVSTPTAGGTLTINGEALGSYDYVIKRGNQTVTSFNAADWFTSTEDYRSAIIVVVGDLTIDAAQVFTPSVRKLFSAIYVTGSLTVNGEISMSRRGANHSAATGSNITAAAIRLATGTFDGVTNPQVPAVGASGGARVTRSGASSGSSPGEDGDDGTDGATGGGGSGGTSKGTSTSYTVQSGAGAAGSSFSGGPGGGGVVRNNAGAADDGADFGGVGGAASLQGTSRAAGGGAGNPAGAKIENGVLIGDSEDGTGGVLFIAVEVELSGSGAITASGAASGSSGGASEPGGASGGGSVTVMCGSNTSSITPTALGGIAGTGSQVGGNGGDGTARILEGL